MTVEVGEDKKALKVLNGSGLRPTSDGIHFPLVHLYTVPGDDVPQEVDGVVVELSRIRKEIFPMQAANAEHHSGGVVLDASMAQQCYQDGVNIHYV